MFDNMLLVFALIIGNLILGILISLFFSRRKIHERDEYIEELGDSITEKDENYGKVMKLVSDKEKLIDDLESQILLFKEEILGLNEQIKELNTSIDLQKEEMDETDKRLRKEVDKKEEYLQELKTLATRTKESVTAKDINLENLKSQLNQREAIILSLTSQVEERTKFITDLKEELAHLRSQSQQSMVRSEDANEKIRELELKIHEKDFEINALKKRHLAMQDDFTLIAGIGPKIAAILRLAKIKTFTQLATTNVDKLSKILEAENRGLVYLVDPSTWPEQAKIASEGNWEALSTLQDSLKGVQNVSRKLIKEQEEEKNDTDTQMDEPTSKIIS